MTAQPAEILRPWRPIKDTLIAFGLWAYDPFFAFLRRFLPAAGTSGFRLLARNDDVRDVLRRDADFRVNYTAKLRLVMDGGPGLLGLDRAFLSDDLAAISQVVTRADVPVLADAAGRRCAELLAADGDGTVEVVDLISQVVREVFGDWIGVGDPPGEDLRIIAMRLFEFVLADVFNDKDLKAEVIRLSRVLRDHVDHLIATRAPDPAGDVLARCLARKAANDPWFTDANVRTLMVGLVFAALPQPQMAAALILDQLLRRPAELAEARALARERDGRLSGYVFEAFRFNPMVPALFRHAEEAAVIGAGTGHTAKVKTGAMIVTGLRSAVKDPRRVAQPRVFDPTRDWTQFPLFGDGPHTCLAEHINRALLPAVVGEILRQDGLQRAPGDRGMLVMRGFLVDRLWVKYG